MNNKVAIIVGGALAALLIIVGGVLAYTAINDSNSPAPTQISTPTPSDTTDPASVLNDVMEQNWATLSYSDQVLFCTGFQTAPDELFRAFSDGFEGSAGTAFPRSVFDSFYGAKCVTY